METLVQRLVANPHDQEALAYAHQAGAADPRAYASLLERVGMSTQDPGYASHWLSEAANVWAQTLGDAHRAAQILMAAIDKDPTQQVAADRLAQLYRDRGEIKGLAALLERRAKALTPYIGQSPEMRAHVASMYEELGRLWADAPLSQPRKAIEHYRRAMEVEPRSVYAIYGARELYKAAQQWADAIGLFDAEQALVDDPARKVALWQDEAAVRQQAGDKGGATQVLRNARSYQPEDATLIQELAALIVDRVKGGEAVPPAERDEAASLYVTMAETYGGEHGYAYSCAALDAQPGHDRAMQLAAYFGEQLGRAGELPSRWKSYLSANPNGALADEARSKSAGASARPPAPPAATPSPAKPVSVPSQPRANAAPPVREQEDSVEALDDLRAADAASPEKIRGLLGQAGDAASKGNKAAAFTKYKEVLALDAGNGEALAWVKDHLRQKRLYGELRDTLVAAGRSGLGADEKKQVLRELAGLCEQQLRDVEGAIQALKQLVGLDRSDSAAGESLRRLLEKSSRWDELASVLEEEAMGASDVEEKLGLEKKLAQLHETKRKDLVGAAEAWARIANLTPQDDQAVWTAVKLFEKAEKPDLAAQVIADAAVGIEDKVQKSQLLQRLGELREKAGDLAGAGEAFGESATLGENPKTWELAEKAYVAAERWAEAAQSVDSRAELAAGDPKLQASLYARAADLFNKAGDEASAVARLEQAVELDPSSDENAAQLEERYVAAERHDDLAGMLLKRAESVPARDQRVALRTRAAEIQRDKLDNMDAARESLMKVLEDGDDFGALTILVDDAEQREEYTDAAALLRRLAGVATDTAKKVEVRLREARLLADRLDDQEGAVSRYESILSELDPKHRGALAAIADLEERRDNPQGAASALERELPLAEGEDRVTIARRLAGLYEGALSDDAGAVKALEVVVAADEEDFEAIARLAALTERTESWARTAELLHKLIEVEGDEEEVSRLARKLAGVLDEKLSKPDEALAVLEGPADDGDSECREVYVTLGDRVGWKGIVATKLVAWNEARGASAERNAALRGAFDRFVEIGRDADASRVAMELARGKSADGELAKKLEEIGVRAKDIDAIQTAHDLLARDLSGPARAEELIRQAEVLVQSGVDPLEATQHGEAGLASVPAGEAEPLLARLAALSPATGHAVDVYERQVSRAKVPADRLRALARAAQVSAERGAIDRARGFFELALAGGAQEETLVQLEEAARNADGEKTELRRTLAEALAAGGQGARDGGRTRAALLRRAAKIAERDLADLERAFGWLGDALVAYVEPASLDALESLGRQIGDIARAEATLTRALGEVFDGPLVRQLLARRAQLRKTELGDKPGAAQDLKKLHDLAPTDHAIMEELGALLTELGDFRGMVQVLEDQILRGKDPAARAELARRVAVLWEERLADAREAADAWRRVLRMKPGDTDAQSGLERAKGNMLRKAPEGTAPVVAPPPAPKPSTPPPKPSAPPPKPSAPAPAPADAPVVEPPKAAVPEKPQRPDITFGGRFEDEATVMTPTNQPLPRAAMDSSLDELPPHSLSPAHEEATHDEKARITPHEAIPASAIDFSRTDVFPAATFEDEPTRVGHLALQQLGAFGGGEEEEEIESVDDAELLDENDLESTHSSGAKPKP